MDDFPSLLELQSIIYKENFNMVLTITKNRMILAKRVLSNYARMTVNDFNMIPNQVVSDVKDFLRNRRGYTITDIEDNDNVIKYK